jgi:hypothetical protein
LLVLVPTKIKNAIEIALGFCLVFALVFVAGYALNKFDDLQKEDQLNAKINLEKCGPHRHIVMTRHSLGSEDWGCEIDRKYKHQLERK